MTKVQFLSTLFPTAHKVDTVMDVRLHTLLNKHYVNKRTSNKLTYLKNFTTEIQIHFLRF